MKGLPNPLREIGGAFRGKGASVDRIALKVWKPAKEEGISGKVLRYGRGVDALQPGAI